MDELSSSSGSVWYSALQGKRSQDSKTNGFIIKNLTDRWMVGASASIMDGVMPFETAKSKTTTTRATRKGQKEKAAEIRPMDNVQRPDAKRQGMGDHDVEVDPAG